MGKKVGVSQEEKNLSYYKYFEQDLAPIPAEKLAVLKAGPADPKTLIPFEKRQLFLEGKDEAEGYCQVGFGILEDGTAEVCNTTYMPGVTSEMLDWWFPWHSVGSDLRYKIWDPEDHYFARADRADYVTDPAVPMNEKTWGINHYIIEDVGPGPEFLKLCFKKPSDLGYDMAAIGTEKCKSMVCAIGESSCAAVMTHKWYPYEDGVMFCSRFWIGYVMTESGEVVKALPEGASLPPIVPQGLYAHNIKEFTNLAAILPTLYEEEKDVF
ncbi:MAG: phloretin hydrolase [Clostridiales bacterium]|nr:phloretin hydrolase [Clostridiales bacterium]